MTDEPRSSFIVIGENIHASRTVLRNGSRVVTLPDGRPGLPFIDETGASQVLPVGDDALDGPAGSRQKVKHVKAAVLAGLGSDTLAAELGRAYVRAMARQQAEAEPRYLDLNVDEVTTDLAGRAAAIRWLVEAVGDATGAELAIDSSSPDVVRAGLAASARHGRRSRPLLNSAAHDRLDVLDLAVGAGSPVVLSATGAGGMPRDADQRVANARQLIEAATARGLGLSDLYVDALVMPVAVDPEVGGWFLDAVRALRMMFGAEIHLIGGLSNVSFGLPARRLVNDVFIDLAVSAGADGGIIDPVANDPRRVFAQDRTAPSYRCAADLLTGVDPYGTEFLRAYRAGELD